MKFIVDKKDLRENGDGTYTLTVEPTEKYVPSEYTAISPMDGRYAKTGKKFSPYFSEFALVKYRVEVEVLWLQYFVGTLREKNVVLGSVVDEKLSKLSEIFKNFSEEDFFEVKRIESVTNHDVKSVELSIVQQLEKIGLPQLKSFVHIGCTSEDITNCSYALMIQNAIDEVWYPNALKLVEMLNNLAQNYKDIPMLAFTHGQPATPTTVGKEFGVVAYRLRDALDKVNGVFSKAKWNGATGNYSAISFAYPEEDWIENSIEFVTEYLGLDFNPVTTQIESHDYFCEIAANIQQYNRIVANFCNDMRTYISMKLFKQIPVKSEVGSSTMPHKINPIDFENGQANLDKSTWDFEFMRETLTDSWMQRDLRDSTVQRNLGPAFAHSLLGIERTINGLKKVEVDNDEIARMLNSRWEVLAEPVQTVLRKHGVPDAYNRLKEITRGKNITREALLEFLNSEEIKKILPEEDLKRLLELTPEKYIGLAPTIVEKFIQ